MSFGVPAHYGWLEGAESYAEGLANEIEKYVRETLRTAKAPASQASPETKRIIVFLEELLETAWHHFEHDEAGDQR